MWETKTSNWQEISSGHFAMMNTRNRRNQKAQVVAQSWRERVVAQYIADVTFWSSVFRARWSFREANVPVVVSSMITLIIMPIDEMQIMPRLKPTEVRPIVQDGFGSPKLGGTWWGRAKHNQKIFHWSYWFCRGCDNARLSHWNNLQLNQWFEQNTHEWSGLFSWSYSFFNLSIADVQQ